MQALRTSSVYQNKFGQIALFNTKASMLNTPDAFSNITKSLIDERDLYLSII